MVGGSPTEARQASAPAAAAKEAEELNESGPSAAQYQASFVEAVWPCSFLWVKGDRRRCLHRPRLPAEGHPRDKGVSLLTVLSLPVEGCTEEVEGLQSEEAVSWLASSAKSVFGDVGRLDAGPA